MLMATPRKPKRFLTAEQKYDVFVRILTGQTTQGAAATELGVDRTVITRIRSVARDGAIAALQASRPGKPSVSKADESEIVELRAEVARLERTVIEQRRTALAPLGLERSNHVADGLSMARPCSSSRTEPLRKPLSRWNDRCRRGRPVRRHRRRR
jgi:transposase